MLSFMIKITGSSTHQQINSVSPTQAVPLMASSSAVVRGLTSSRFSCCTQVAAHTIACAKVID